LPIARVDKLSLENGKEFAAHAHIFEKLQSKVSFNMLFANLEHGSNQNLKELLLNILTRRDLCPRSLMSIFE
jgi:IS30 family transposase